MLGLMFEKLWHKKWMNCCLLLGVILLIGTVVSFPLYKRAAFDRMLQDEFENYIESVGSYPTIAQFSTTSQKDKSGETITKIRDFRDSLASDLDLTVRNNTDFLFLVQSEATSTMNRSDADPVIIRLASMTDLESHVKLLSGDMYSSQRKEDGSIDVIISQSCMVNDELLIGESLEFKNLKDVDGNPIKVNIVGVFDALDSSDPYWQYKTEKLNNDLLMDADLFDEMFTGANAGKYTISCHFYSIFDYSDITSNQVSELCEKLTFLTEESSYRSVIKVKTFLELLTDYNENQTRIVATLTILQIPVLVMLASFLLMISGQMYEMERNEISVIKSRGSSKGQIFKLYFYQGLFLTITGTVLGIPLGYVFSKILGATRNFLEFSNDEEFLVTFTFEALIYALIGAFVCLLSITLPAIRHSKVSIVNLKTIKATNKKRLWEKLYIDIVLLGVSLYGFYSFKKNSNVTVDVLSGKSLDPLLYISSSLFIIGAGLLFLRIQPYLVKLIYLIGKKHYGPAATVSFMDNIKNGRKQQLIMLFLIMTISLGMYHATVARTILDNAIENTDYVDGADVIIKEIWTPVVSTDGLVGEPYIVPDYSKYGKLEAAESYTRVYYNSSGYVAADGRNRITITAMGIHTKEFGNVIEMDSSLIDKHINAYLNDLAVTENGVLVSSNFKEKFGYEIGDSFYYSVNEASLLGVIAGFVDYFPGYIPSEIDYYSDGTAYLRENYLVVGHYDVIMNKLGTTPYEVWINVRDDSSPLDVYNWVQDNEVKVQKYINKMNDIKSAEEDPLLQGTNGVLTMGFVVTLILCAVGYLIYWIMSIKERELMFGVLRACGFHKGEVIHMLILEQIFCGIFSILAGIGIGKITSELFVPMLQEAYASRNQAIPMRLITNATDLIRLYGVIALVVLLALLVLLVLVSKMNVTKALKLGEE